MLSSPQENSPTLLVECLGHVLSFLKANQVPTLHSLLRVSKTVFSLTVPILYQNPFLLVRNHRFLQENEKIERHVLLLRLFFSEVDPALLVDLPPLILEDEDEDEISEWDGNGFVARPQRHDQALQPKSYSAQTGGYFRHYRSQDHSFLVAHAIPLLFGTTTQTQSQNILGQLDEIFLKHCGSRVHSMCLASIRVQRFSVFIPVLSCLKRLEIHHIKRVTESSLKELVQWIKKHDEVHGTLRELQIGGLTAFNYYDMNDRKDLVQLPQAFKKLLALDTRSWTEAWSMIDQVEVETLDRLTMDYGDGQAPKNGDNFLVRCRSLKILDLFVPATYTFEGVANLFRMRQSGFAVEGSLATAVTGQGTVIPPVERLYVSGDHENLLRALDDAAVGLSGTLRVLKATSMARHSVLKPSLTWGRPSLQIQMPFLQELQLQGDIALEFHFSLLRCCPNLISLKLMVNGMESCGQVDNPIDEILTLKKLQTLQLLGRWPLSTAFVRGIGSQLTGLKILDLARCFGVSLRELMEAVHGLEFLWRVGWDVEEEEDVEDVVMQLADWQQRAPGIRVGFIHWDEFYV